jgi:hypothetical protein
MGFSLSFFLDKKERKNQDAAKLQPHEAGRWPAAASASSPIRLMFCGKKARLSGACMQDRPSR